MQQCSDQRAGAVTLPLHHPQRPYACHPAGDAGVVGDLNYLVHVFVRLEGPLDDAPLLQTRAQEVSPQSYPSPYLGDNRAMQAYK